MDVSGAGKKDGTQVVQWDYNGGKNQLWNFNDPKEITSSSSEMDWLICVLNFINFKDQNALKYISIAFGPIIWIYIKVLLNHPDIDT